MIAVHFDKKGRILSEESWPFEEAPTPDPGCDAVLLVGDDHCVDGKVQYVELSKGKCEIRDRAHTGLDYSVKGLTVVFNNLTEEHEVEVKGQTLKCSQGSNSVEFEVPGRYTFWVRGSAKHLDEKLEVVVG